MNDKQHTIPILGICIWSIAVFFFLYEFFLRVFIGTLAHQIIPDLGLSITSFTLISTSYHIAYGSMQIPVGMLFDKFGTKKILAFASMTCALSAFFFAASTDVYTAMLSRIIMGFGSSFAFLALLIIISNWFNRENFAFISGISQFIGTMGPLLAGGPLVAALTLLHGDWRKLLNLVGCLGIALFLLVLLIVKNKKNRDSSEIIQLSHNIPTKIILKTLLKNPQVWFVGIYSATIYVPLALLGSTWGTSFLETHHFSQNNAAGIISLTWLGYAIGCIATGFYSDKSNKRKHTLFICSFIGLSASLMILYYSINSTLLYQLLFFSIGFAASGQNVGFAAISEHVTKNIRGSALGFNNTFIIMLNALLQTTVGLIINQAAKTHGSQPTLHDYTIGLSVIPFLYFFSMIISSILFKETYCKPRKEVIILRPRKQLITLMTEQRSESS